MSDGLNGNMRMANSQNKYNGSSASFSANYRKDKLGISANLNGGENIDAQRYDLKNGTSLIQNQSVGDVNYPNKYIGGYLNFDYQLNDNSNLALSWNTSANKSFGSTVDLLNTLNVYNENGTLKSTEYNTSKNRENARSYNNSVNLNYELKTDSLGSKLNLNAAYFNYKRFMNSDNRTLVQDTNGNFIQPRQMVLQDLPQLINNFSAMEDYIKKFKKDFTLSVGGNFNKTKTDNDTKNYFYFYDDAGNLNNIRPDLNYFIYDENIYGFYLTAEKKFSDKFSGKLGARYEITKSTGTSEVPNQPIQVFGRNYTNLLPYLSVNYAINENNNISYSFSSRMRRPSFWELNPVKNILTEDNYTQNNPFVKASSSYNQELTYMFKNSYFLILNHSFFKDVITQVPLQRDIVRDGVTYRQLTYIRTNFGDKQEMTAMIGMQKQFFNKTLTTNFNTGFQHNINDGSLNTDPTKGAVFDTYVNQNRSTSLIIQTNNTLSLDKKKTWFLGANFFYVDKQQIELGMLKNLASLDLSIKKNWNDWTFALNVNDVLRTNIVEIEDYQANGNYNYVMNDQFRRGGTLSIAYNFGNQKVKKVRNIEGTSDSIKNRTR